MKMSTTSLILFLAFLVPSLALIPKSFPASRALADLQLRLTPTSNSYPESNTSNRDSTPLTAESISKESFIRHNTGHKKWGVDNTNEYWFDSRIHTLGNSGFMGAVHAASAPIATKMIDVLAYDGVDIRQKVADELSGILGKGKARVIDLCCGVGTSTRALRNAFPNGETVMGVDSSPEMVAMADLLTTHLSFMKPLYEQWKKSSSTSYTVMKEQGNKINKKIKQAASKAFPNKRATFSMVNAEDTKLPDKSFDLVTIMYAFHEAPKAGRDKMLKEARRLLQPGGMLAVIDISPDYEPSESMLKGEPYVLEYQSNINRQLESFKGFFRPEYKTLVPGHVGMWLLKRSATVV